MAGNTVAQVVGLEREKEFVFKNTFQAAEFPGGVIKTEASVAYFERFYDDWVAENYAAWQMAGNMNAVKFSFPPYPLTVVGANIYVGNGSFPLGGNFLNKPFRISVYANDGENGMPGTLIDSISVLATNYEWISVTGLNALVTGDFYVAMTQLSNSPDCVPIGVDETAPKANRSYLHNVYTGSPWVLSPYQDFMIHVYITNTVGMNEVIASDAVNTFPNPAHEYLTIENIPQFDLITVYTMAGTKVEELATKNDPVVRLDVSGFPPGLLTLHFTGKKGESCSRKFVKN